MTVYCSECGSVIEDGEDFCVRCGALRRYAFDMDDDGNLTAVVYNIVGQEVLRKDLNANFGQMSLSVADLNDGIYFCTMMVNGSAYATQKFIVKK